MLKRIRWSDTSLIVTMYSLDFGKISAVAKGALRPKSGFFGQLEMFSLVESVLSRREGRDLDTMISAVAMEHYDGIRENPVAFTHACLFSEWVMRLVYENEPNQPVFHLLSVILEEISSGRIKPWALTCAGAEKLMRITGMGIELDKCTICGRDAEESVFFDCISGGIVCKNCGKGKAEVSRGLIEFLKKLREGDLEKADRLRIWPGAYKQCHELLQHFAEAQQQSALRFKSLAILEDLEHGIS